MRSSRKLGSNNHMSQYDSSAAEAAKKRQEDKFFQHLKLAQPSHLGLFQAKKKSTLAGGAKRNSSTQIVMPQLETPLTSDINDENEDEAHEKMKQAQYFNQIASRFMEQGLEDLYHSSEDEAEPPKNEVEKSAAVPEPKIETDIKFLQQDLPNSNEADNNEIPEYEAMEIQTKQVCRIKMRFKLTVAKSTLPKKMPETIVYWNRCETKVNTETQQLVTQQQLDDFQEHCGVKLHDYPEARAKVAKNFPFLDDKEIWADPSQEQFVNQMESLITYSPELKSWINQLNMQLPVEGNIIIENPRDTDVFFNSKFESGNLKQAFIVPQPSDFDELTDEEAMIGDYLPKEEKEYLRSMLDKRREKRRETAQKSLQEPNSLLKSPSDPTLETQNQIPINEQRSESAAVIGWNNNKSQADAKPASELKSSPSEQKLIKTNSSEAQIKKPKKQGTFKSEYNLYLQDDTHSDGSRTQWFYLSVMNIKGGNNVKINIVNMTKPDSSFQKGMQVFVFSTKQFRKTGLGWHRAGKNITYQRNGRTQRSQIKVMDIKYLQGQQSDEQQPDSFKELSTLSFIYKFKFDSDIVYFAHGQPYTYSDYANYICQLEANSNFSDRMRIDHLCNSVGKNPVYCLTITSKIQTKYVSQGKEQYKWQKFEYSNNQSVDQIKPKKQKREEVSDDEESKPKTQSPLLPAKQESVSKSKFNQPVPVPTKSATVIEQQSMLQGRLSRIPEVYHDAESNFQHEDDKHSVIEENQHFDQKPNLDLSSDEEDKKKKKVPAKELKEKFYKKAIVITSRVHPGESQSSLMIEGLINYLLSDEDEAREIREKFVIKIVPMLNPDGVILGNSRSSLIGVDLNRRWLKPSKFLHPTIYYTKSLIKYLNKKLHQPEVRSGGVVLFTDIHGHNKYMDIFMYGCVVERDYAYHEGNMLIRSIPDGVDRQIPVFSSQKCKFAIEPNKVETGRIVVFREFGILNSYTLECSFNGSEHLQRTKQIYMALYSQDYMQTVNQRYQISAQRTNIQFDTNTYFQAGADFIRGVNWSSKRKPILTTWYRVEPKNIVDQNVNSKPDAESEIEDQLKELENRWRPTGNILDDGKTGMTEKYGGLSLPYIFDGPLPVDDTLEKVAKRKKEKAEREQKRRQQDSLLKYSKMSGSKENKRDIAKDQHNLNADIAIVSKPTSRKNSARKNATKPVGIRDESYKRKARGIQQTDSIEKIVSSQSEYDEDYESGAENSNLRPKSPQSLERQGMNWTARNQTKLFNKKEEFDIASPSPSKRVIDIHAESNYSSNHGSKEVKYDLLQMTTHSFQQHQLNEKLFEVVDQQDQLSKSRKKEKNSRNGFEKHHSTTVASKVASPKDQNRDKGGRKDLRINLWDQKISNKNQFKVNVDIPAIDHKVMLEGQNSASGQDKSKFGFSIKDQTLENFARLSIINQSSQDVSPAVIAVEKRSPSRKQFKRISFGSSIESESENDELKLPPIFPKSQSVNSQNNLLSADPLVVSSKQLQQMSRVKLQTIVTNQRDFSPFKTPNNKQDIFAPINGVYSQRSLMSNSGLADKKNINFIWEQGQDQAFKGRKMTQLYYPSKALEIQKPEPAQNLKPRLTSILSNSPVKAIEMKNGFELSPQRFEEASHLSKDQQSGSQKLKLVSRPHIILKPLAEVDWMALQQSPKRRKQRMYNDLTEVEQRETLRKLQQVVGTIEIRKNRLMIGRTQLLPMIARTLKERDRRDF